MSNNSSNTTEILDIENIFNLTEIQELTDFKLLDFYNLDKYYTFDNVEELARCLICDINLNAIQKLEIIDEIYLKILYSNIADVMTKIKDIWKSSNLFNIIHRLYNNQSLIILMSRQINLNDILFKIVINKTKNGFSVNILVQKQDIECINYIGCYQSCKKLLYERYKESVVKFKNKKDNGI